MSDNSVDEFNQFIEKLQVNYPYIVIPVDEVDEVLKQFKKISDRIPPEVYPELYLEALYWKYRILHTKIGRGKKYDLIEEFIETAQDLEQPPYILYGQLVEISLGNERKYLSNLFILMKKVAEFDQFHPLIFEQLMSHVAKLSGFYVDVLAEMDSVEQSPIFSHIYTYLSYSSAEQRLSCIDRHCLLNLLRLEEKITASTTYLDLFLADSRDLFVAENNEVPSYFYHPYKDINEDKM